MIKMSEINQLPKEMKKKYEIAKKIVKESKDIKIYSHIDCDGISAGAILSIILDRLGKEHEIDFVNLDVLDDLELNHELTIFSDLGSGQPILKNVKKGQKIIVLDHHPPLRDLDYCKGKDYTYLEINPNHYDIDGSYFVCGGGLCYFLAKEFGFEDLSWIGVLSAIGDMQNARTGKLEGLNKIILEDSIKNGYVKKIPNDISLYGRQTRPLFVALSYFSDVKLPITNNTDKSIRLLEEISVSPFKVVKDDNILFDKDESIKKSKTKKENRTLADLNEEEKERLYKKLLSILAQEVPLDYVQYVPKLVSADSYEFIKEEDHSFLKDASEFSTAMNACGRNNKAEVALEILKGNRLDALDYLEEITKDHKRYLAKCISEVSEEGKIIELDNLQYFNGNDIKLDGENIKPEIVGTVAGMILSYGNWKKPIIGFTNIDKDNLKISLRCSRLLSYNGIHFGNIIRDISQKLGGNGGGHSVACGAYIPEDKKFEFINTLNSQLNGMIVE